MSFLAPAEAHPLPWIKFWLALETVPERDAVSRVSVSTDCMTYCDSSDVYIATKIAARIAHPQRNLRTARTASAVQSIHFIIWSTYFIDSFGTLITPQSTDRPQPVEKHYKFNIKSSAQRAAVLSHRYDRWHLCTYLEMIKMAPAEEHPKTHR